MQKSIVMLEDDRDDRYLTSEVLSELKIGVPVQFFSTSTDLMDYLLHHPKFDLDERALPIGTAMLVATAKRFLQM